VSAPAPARPGAVLICHEGARINQEGIARWLASFTDLRGILLLREKGEQKGRRVRREIRRLGVFRFLDVIAMRIYYALFLAESDRRWVDGEVERLRAAYAPVPESTRVLVTDSPNRPEAVEFLRELAPDVVVARCKQLLREEVFSIPAHGTLVFHPGVCPEYRNAHGCFWALASDDLGKVGATLLRIDKGVDTGPVYGYFSYAFDELKDSHMVVQFRVVTDNLDALRESILRIVAGTAERVDTTGRPSAVWGQPWLTKYLRWRRQAKRRARERGSSVYTGGVAV
jgi:folate-dependent phosphoribosylglycinamide formyltransferase PurN